MNATRSANASHPRISSHAEVIDLLDDSDDESVEVINTDDDLNKGGSGGPTGTMQERKTMADITNATPSAVAAVTSQLEVMEVSAPAWQPVAAAPGHAEKSGNDEDAELAIVATRGKNALVDFPHCRSNCAKHPFDGVSERQKHCDNCYCDVCDIPAAKCTEWSSHCEASHEDKRWRKERDAAKRNRKATAAAATRDAAPAGRTTATMRRAAATRGGDFSVLRILERVTGVYPVEMRPEAGSGFRTPLRHYQMQSLAFMVDSERRSNRGGFLCDDVGMGKVRIPPFVVVSSLARCSSLMAFACSSPLSCLL